LRPLLHRGHVLVHLGLLGGHQHDVHGGARFGSLAHHLVVQVDIVDGKGDVMFGLELDRVGQLLRIDLGELDLLHDELSA